MADDRTPGAPDVLNETHHEVQPPVRFVVKSRDDTHVTLVWKAPKGEHVVHFELDKARGLVRGGSRAGGGGAPRVHGAGGGVQGG